jgi:hypothetical protein
MTGFLLVAVAHGLDLVTFMVAVAVHGIGGEANPLARAAFVSLGLLGLVALKVAGTAALACIAHMRPWALIPATGSGLVGAVVNSLAV